MDFQHAAGGSAQQRVHLKPEVILLHPVQYAKLSTPEGLGSRRWVGQTELWRSLCACMHRGMVCMLKGSLQAGRGGLVHRQLFSRRLIHVAAVNLLKATSCRPPQSLHMLNPAGTMPCGMHATTSGLSSRVGPALKPCLGAGCHRWAMCACCNSRPTPPRRWRMLWRL